MVDITWRKFVARLHRLYEQKKTSADCDVVLGEYLRRWFIWAEAGLKAIKTPHDGGADKSYKHFNLSLSSVFPPYCPECNKT